MERAVPSTLLEALEEESPARGQAKSGFGDRPSGRTATTVGPVPGADKLRQCLQTSEPIFVRFTKTARSIQRKIVGLRTMSRLPGDPNWACQIYG